LSSVATPQQSQAFHNTDPTTEQVDLTCRTSRRVRRCRRRARFSAAVSRSNQLTKALYADVFVCPFADFYRSQITAPLRSGRSWCNFQAVARDGSGLHIATMCMRTPERKRCRVVLGAVASDSTWLR